MSDPTEAQVLDALRPIQDPDFHRSIVDLGFIKQLQIEGGHVSFQIELTTPACPVKAEFERKAHEVVSTIPGVTQVDVTMTANTRGGQRAANPEILTGVRNIVAVASGKGGVGKSTVSVNLALALSEAGSRVGLMDVDIHGPSMPLMLNVRGQPDVTPEKKIVPLESYGLRIMSIGFLAGEDAPVIWRGPMVHGIVQQFMKEVDWGELDYLILDMPPGTGDAALTVCQNAPLSGALIVTTPQEVSLIDARKGLKMFERVKVPVIGIIENMSYFECPGCHERHTIFGEGGGARAAKELGTELLIQVPLQPDVVEAGDQGTPTVLSNPESVAGRAFTELGGIVARRLAVLSTETPQVLGSNIEWVDSPS